MSLHGDEPKDYHTLNDVANKAIITQLAEESGDQETSAVINCYTIGASDREIRKLLYKQLVPPLKKAATYLGLETEGEAKILKDDVISFIINRIETLMKDLCGICGHYYNNSLQDQPLFTCLICKQGCHLTCFEEMNTILNGMSESMRDAFKFLCTSCQGDFSKDPSTAPKLTKSPTKTQTHINGDDQDLEVSSVASHEGRITRNADDSSVGSPASPISSERPPPEMLKPVCPEYKWGRCPNYEDCEYRHPPRCWSWLSKGKCSYKNKCRYHHPPLCYNSLWEKKCFDEKCKYFHLTQTQRFKIEDEQLKGSLHYANYHAQHNQQPFNGQNQPPTQLAAQHYPSPNYQQSNVLQQQRHHPPQPSVVTQQQMRPAQLPQQQVPQLPQAQQNRSFLNPGDLSFLAKTIKDIIREDLGKEIADIKLKLNSQAQRVNSPHILNTLPMQPTQPTTNLYSLHQVTPTHQ
jgi:hypothetical protein